MRSFRSAAVACGAIAALATFAHAQFLMVADSGRGKVFLCDPMDGSVIDDDFITEVPGGPFTFGTIKEALQVGNEIWVTDQTEDAIWRFTATLNPAFVGSIPLGLDNMRGLCVVGAEVFVSNGDGGNGATANSIAVYDFAGTRTQTYLSSPGISPFDCEPFNADILVSNSSNHQINRFSTLGTFLNTFHAGAIRFPQQVHVANSGPGATQEVWAAGFSTPSGLYRYDASGAQIGYFNAVAGLRGCWYLGDGTVLVTASGTLAKVDPSDNTFFAVPVPVGASLHNIALLTPTLTPPPTNPFVIGVSAPSPVAPGQNTSLNATVFPGTTPDSTSVIVTADLSAFGGSSSQAFTDLGSNQHAYVLSVPVMQAGGNYTIPITVTDAEMRTTSSQFDLFVFSTPPVGFVVESENNSTKDLANPAAISAGQGVFGITTGTSTTLAGAINTADYFLITTPAQTAGIYRHRMVITTDTPGHVGTLRGLTQTASSINAGTDATVQTSSTTSTPQRFNQWYGFTSGTQMHYRVTGSSATTTEYTSTLETESVTPIDLGTTLEPGMITIFRGSGNATTIDMLVYDQTFTAVADFNTDGGPSMTRTFTPGTYYLAVSNSNTTDSRAAGPESTATTNAVFDFAGAVANSSTTVVSNLTMRFFDSASNDVEVFASKTGPYEVAWISFVVGGPVPCPGNYNTDSTVDLLDLLAFNSAYSTSLGQNVPPGTNGDYDANGVVDLLDLLAFIGDWSTNLGTPCP